MISITVSGINYMVGEAWVPQDQYLDVALALTNWDEASISPLQQILGFEASEELYDTLSLREQLILDLLMAGWNQTQIARIFDLSQSTISVTQKRIRYHLANSKLRLILESRGKES